jgi:hypothetical protein
MSGSSRRETTMNHADACEWLKVYLDENGPTVLEVLVKASKEAGMSEETFNEALSRLGIVWTLSLPRSGENRQEAA